MLFKVKENNLYMYGVIWDGDDRIFDEHFSQLEKKYERIVIHLHTPGGSVFAGNFIIQRLQNSKSYIQIDVVGTAFSMGAILLTAADKRRMVENGYIMIHAPRGIVEGTAADHRSAAKLLENMEENFIEQLQKITNLPESKVKKLMQGDNYFSAKDALKIGLIDEIIKPVTKTKISDLSAMRPNDIYGSFAAVLAQLSDVKPKTKQTMKEALIHALGLTGLTPESSDTAVIEAVKAHFEKQLSELKSELEKEKKLRAELEEKMKEQTKARIDALLAPLKGKITEKQEETYRKIAETSGIEALETVLNGIGRKSLKDFINHGKGTGIAGRENWDWDKWQAEDPRGLERLAEEDPETFLALGRAKFGKHFTIN